MSTDKVPFEHPWDEVLIGEVADVIVGGTPSTAVPRFWGGDIPWMSSGDIHLKRILDVPGRITQDGLSSSNAKLIDPPAVAMALAGQGKTRGTVAITLASLTTNQSVALIKPSPDRLDTEYLFHALAFRYDELRSRSSGEGRAGLSKGLIEQIPLPLPPPEEQTAIAEVLATVDRAIAQSEALIAKQRRIKAGLLHDLLTRGIDEEGNLRHPSKHRFKASPVGLVPEEWEVGALSTYADVLGGKRLPAGHNYAFVSTGYRYLRVLDFFEKEISLSDLENLERTTFEALARYEIHDGNLYISIAGSIGYCGVLRVIGDERFILTENAAKIRIKGEYVPEFLAMQINGHQVQKQINEAKGTGGGVPKLALFRIEKLFVAKPPLDEQTQICEYYAAANRVLNEQMKELSKLHRLKTGLMQDLLSGRVSVAGLLQMEGLLI